LAARPEHHYSVALPRPGGGAGLLNVRPLLRWCDVFCLGRAEEYVVPLVKAALPGEAFEHPSVIRAADFDPEGSYLIDAGNRLYPHPVPLANGKTWSEASSVCPAGPAARALGSRRRRTGRGGDPMIRRLIPFLLPILLLTGCVRTIYVPHGMPVHLRETVEDVKVWGEDLDGEPVAGKMDLPEGWYALPLAAGL